MLELMKFIIANESVVNQLNEGKVHAKIKSLVALQKYLIKQLPQTFVDIKPKTFALICQ